MELMLKIVNMKMMIVNLLLKTLYKNPSFRLYWNKSFNSRTKTLKK